MQNSGSSIAQSEAIQEWLQNGMGYRPQGSYSSSNNVAGVALPPWIRSERSVMATCNGAGKDEGRKGWRKEKEKGKSGFERGVGLEGGLLDSRK
ncbi:hypothetical protein Scep_004500 [Stephania cephalantha]|uniref:Uncharacterized protein n=1 Tax=Stephania cephalantha TaxID=152367 RepID=A0AAP0KSK9_9MAGN